MLQVVRFRATGHPQIHLHHVPQPVVKTQTRQRSVPKVVFDVRTITVSQKEVYLWRGKPRSAIPDVCREQVPTLVKETTRVPIVHEVQINVPRTITRQQAVQDPDQEVIEEVTIQMQQQVLNPAWHEPFTVQRVPVPVKTGKMVKQMRPVQKTVKQMQAVGIKRASDSFTRMHCTQALKTKHRAYLTRKVGRRWLLGRSSK